MIFWMYGMTILTEWMKIKKVNHILFLILSFLSLVTWEYIFIYLIDKPRDIKSAGKNLLPNYPSYSQICIRRGLNQLDISSNGLDDDDNKDIIIAIDSTGIKITNRGHSGCKKNGRSKRRRRRKTI